MSLTEAIFARPSYSQMERLIAAEEVKNRIMSTYVGTPLVASTAVSMTDTNRIYVYVGSETGYTSGNWYYYDGSAWTSGGVYNSTAFETDDTLTIPDAAADSKAVGDELSDLKNALTAAEIVDTASGAIASFSDGGDGFAVRGLTVQMEPIQDLHGYDHPWPAGGGKNKIPYPYTDGASITVNGVTFTVSSDGTVTANGTATANAEYRLVAGSVQLPSGSYTLSGLPSGASSSTFVYNTYAGSSPSSLSDLWDSRIEADTTFTASEDVARLYIAIRITSGYTANNLVFKPMFESGSTATTYVPYSNICPISGRDSVTVTRTGKNVLNAAEALNNRSTIYTVNADDSITVASSDGYAWGDVNAVPLKAGTYTFSFDASANCNADIRLSSENYETGHVIYKSGSTGSTANITLAEDGYYKLKVGYSASSYPITVKVQLESGSTATEWSPYTAQTVEIQLGQTVYGGTLDVTQGVLTVDKIGFDGGSVDLVKINSPYSYGTFYISVPDGLYNANRATLICSNYRSEYNNALQSESLDLYCWMRGLGSSAIYVKDTSMASMTEEQIKTAMSGVQFVYELATPQTYQLTPQQITTLLGQNNVWSDADSVAVDYVSDTKLYIAKVIADALS